MAYKGKRKREHTLLSHENQQPHTHIYQGFAAS